MATHLDAGYFVLTATLRHPKIDRQLDRVAMKQAKLK